MTPLTTGTRPEPGYAGKVCVIVRRRVVPSFHYNYGKLRPASNSCFSSVTDAAYLPRHPVIPDNWSARENTRIADVRLNAPTSRLFHVCFTFVVGSSTDETRSVFYLYFNAGTTAEEINVHEMRESLQKCRNQISENLEIKKISVENCKLVIFSLFSFYEVKESFQLNKNEISENSEMQKTSTENYELIIFSNNTCSV